LKKPGLTKLSSRLRQLLKKAASAAALLANKHRDTPGDLSKAFLETQGEVQPDERLARPRENGLLKCFA